MRHRGKQTLTFGLKPAAVSPAEASRRVLGNMPDLPVNDLTLLAATFHYKPFYFYRHLLGGQKLNAFFLNTLLKAPNPCCLFTEDSPRKLIGLASWSESPWDSRNIGYKTARLNFMLSSGEPAEIQTQRHGRLYGMLAEQLRAQGFEYIFCRVNTSDLPSVRVLQDNGFQVVDGLLTLSWPVKTGIWQEDSSARLPLVREARAEDMEAVKKIAATSFIYDRFHTDSAIPDATADQLHANWIEDSFARNPDDHVLAAEKDGRICGFISYSINEKSNAELGLNILNIILVATGLDCRKEGVANALVRKTMEIARARGFDYVHVGTQLRNLKATNLYLKLNFRLVDSGYTLRKVMPARGC